MNPIAFLKEAWVELRKSTWLTRQQAVGSTVVVLALVVVLSIFISGIDFALSLFLGALLGGR
jgi:preprotein translocase subunit SecE